MTKDKPLYTFYDGPPFATGTPHYGHIAAGTIKVSDQFFKKSDTTPSFVRFLNIEFVLTRY